MGHSIRSKTKRIFRALKRTGAYGQVETQRLDRIVTDTTVTHSLSIFKDIVAVPVTEAWHVTKKSKRALLESAEEPELAVNEEIEMVVDVAPMNKRQLDQINLSSNQFKIKYGKYGKGKGKTNKKKSIKGKGTPRSSIANSI